MSCPVAPSVTALAATLDRPPMTVCPNTVSGAPAISVRSVLASLLATLPTMSSVTSLAAPIFIPPNNAPVSAPVPVDHNNDSKLISSRCPTSICPS